MDPGGESSVLVPFAMCLCGCVHVCRAVIQDRLTCWQLMAVAEQKDVCFRPTESNEWTQIGREASSSVPLVQPELSDAVYRSVSVCPCSEERRNEALKQSACISSQPSVTTDGVCPSDRFCYGEVAGPVLLRIQSF